MMDIFSCGVVQPFKLIMPQATLVIIFLYHCHFFHSVFIGYLFFTNDTCILPSTWIKMHWVISFLPLLSSQNQHCHPFFPSPFSLPSFKTSLPLSQNHCKSFIVGFSLLLHPLLQSALSNQSKLPNWKVELLITQSCPTLCNPMDCSLPVFSVQGIHQERTLKWTAIPFSGGSYQPRYRTWVSYTEGKLFTSEPPRKPKTMPWIQQ